MMVILEMAPRAPWVRERRCMFARQPSAFSQSRLGSLKKPALGVRPARV
jgi:hypothetical protein